MHIPLTALTPKDAPKRRKRRVDAVGNAGSAPGHLRSSGRAAVPTVGDGAVADGVPAVGDGAAAVGDGALTWADTAPPHPDQRPLSLDPARQRFAAISQARNAALQAAGHRHARMPRCETNDGRRDKTARKAFLATLPSAFTRSDRSMVFAAADPGYVPGWQPHWVAVVDDKRIEAKDGTARRYASKSTALVACRRLEAKAV